MGYIHKFEGHSDDFRLVESEMRPPKEGMTVTRLPRGFYISEEIRDRNRDLILDCHYLPPQEVPVKTRGCRGGEWCHRLTWEPNQFIIVSTSEFGVEVKLKCGYFNQRTGEVYDCDLNRIGEAREKRAVEICRGTSYVETEYHITHVC